MGRFLSPDNGPPTPLHLLNPQRWNMYAYVINNPLAYTDPSGKDAAAVNFGGMVAGFGHEGILSIHQDGSVTYARFGPVATDNENAFGLDALGEVRSAGPDQLPNVTFGANGIPTAASLANVVAALKSTGVEPSADPSQTRINYFKTSESETANLDEWIQEQARASTRKGASFYQFCSNNCATFVHQGLVAGGAIKPNQANGFFDRGPNALFFDLQGQGNSNGNSVTIKLDGAIDCTNPSNPGCS
jgi:hypothetical protein